jgi:hypothetical protein
MAAAKFGDGLKLKLLVGGVQQVTATEISVEVDGKNQTLETLEGVVGKTPGSGQTTVTATCIVPIGGQEFDYMGAVKDGGYFDLQIPLGAKSYIGNGYFDKASVSQSVGKPTEVQFTWIGAFERLR